MDVRKATAEDLSLLRTIPAAADFLTHPFFVGFQEGSLTAYLAWRPLAPGEAEILHVFTDCRFRRRGFARSLLRFLKEQAPGDLYLEVRESNAEARKLYQTEGFTEVGRRRDYYSAPSEDAIVMKFHSC